jgi:metal-dependent amidase/aminoacylase/carboxypeptidase family protein
VFHITRRISMSVTVDMNEITEFLPEITAIRRDLHAHPEHGFQEGTQEGTRRELRRTGTQGQTGRFPDLQVRQQR